MENLIAPSNRSTACPRTRTASYLFTAASLLMGVTAPISSLLFSISLLIALLAYLIYPEPLRIRLRMQSIRPLLPALLPFALLLLLGAYHTVAHSDHFALLLTALAALIAPLLLTTSAARTPRNAIYLTQGLFLGTIFSALFRQPNSPTAAPYLFLAIVLLLEIIVNTPTLSRKIIVTLCVQIALLIICFAAFDCWPALLLLPLALLSTLAHLIARIPYAIGRLSVWIAIAFIWLFSISYFAHIDDTYFVGHQQDASSLPVLTHNGNPYRHDTLSHDKENGYYVNLYLCPEELEAQWPTVSSLPLSTVTPNGLTVKEALIRYLTSLDLRKDSVGVSQLSPRDVKAIERGVYNATLVRKSFIFKATWHELENMDRYLQSGTPTSLFTTIIDQSTSAFTKLSAAPTLGVGLRNVTTGIPHAIGIFSIPLAIGLLPAALLLLLLAAAACIAALPTKHGAKRSLPKHLGLTALALAIVATLCAPTLLSPAFASICSLLLALPPILSYNK